MDKEYYDLQYDAGEAGRDPDAITIDTYEYLKSQGFYPDEITVEMMIPYRRADMWEEKIS